MFLFDNNSKTDSKTTVGKIGKSVIGGTIDTISNVGPLDGMWLGAKADAVKALTKDLVPVIESFDEYLNMVASEFARVDRELGHVIEGSTFQQYANGKSDAEMRKKRYISEKQREIYKQQYSDFP